MPSPHEVTHLLQAWCGGDQAALDKLVPLVYDELHRLAHIHMVRERPRLIDANQVQWQDRTHFFAISANVMRRILVQFARSRGSRKRGGGAGRVDLDEALIPSPERDTDLIALDDALTALAAIDPREARVVELRFFGGMSVDETVEILQLSGMTVKRDWNHAKAWLLQELKRGARG